MPDKSRLPQAIPYRALRAALAQARPWLRRANVAGLSIGTRHRGGRYRPGETALIVTVVDKLDDADLKKRKIKPFPSSVAVRIGKKQFKVPVDVRGSAGAQTGRFHGLVGSQVRVGDPDDIIDGGIGAVVHGAQGRRLLTAGHVAPQEGLVARFANGTTGTVESVWLTDHLDHAILVPDAPLPPGAATLLDGLAVSGTRIIDDTLLGQPFHFFHAARRVRDTTVIREIHRSVDFGGHRIFDLIVTDFNTCDGDSGTLLFDDDYLAVGTLVGWFGPENNPSQRVSVFLPCLTCFSAIGVSIDTGG